MKKFQIGLLIVILAFCFSQQPAQAAFRQTTTYSVITEQGPIASISATLRAGEKIIKSEDKVTAYKVRTVPVRDAQHLLELMGGDETKLTDLQRGLFETYKFSSTQGFSDLGPRVPASTELLNLDLVDIAGYEDTNRFPSVKDDFWPINSRVYHHNGTEYVTHSEIRISGADCLGFGASASEKMQGTYAHEFGHALDLTSIEQPNAYGFDNSHYVNEQIAPKASLAEGFANFIKWLFFDETEEEFREAVKTVKIERPQGGYDEYPISTDKLVGEGYLNVEAINTLIFARLSAELPNGKTMVLDSFQKHNNSENRMSKFLQNFLKDYPMQGTVVARILDRETLGKLSAVEIRSILGYNPGVESYIQNRPAVVVEQPKVEETPKVEKITHKTGVIYKWQDASGTWHFTELPPDPTLVAPATTRTRSPEPERGRPAIIDGADSNPFNLDN